MFHRKRVPAGIDPIVMGDHNLERMTNTKFLGVILQENLKWDKHIQFVADKVNKISGLLYLTRHKLSFNAMKHIYLFFLVYPFFIYCQTVWGAAGNSKLNQLVIAQKRVIRTMSFMGRRDHTNDAFVNFNLLKFNDINIYFCAIYTYKAINQLIQNRYFTFRHSNHYSLRNQDLLRLPSVGSTQSKSFIEFHGSQIWNSLPFEIRSKPSIQSFKYALRTHLISKYSDPS